MCGDGPFDVVGAVEDVPEPVVGVGEPHVVRLDEAVQQLDGAPVQVQGLGEPAGGVEHLAQLAEQPPLLHAVAPVAVQAHEPQRRLEHLDRGRVQRAGGVAGGQLGERLDEPGGRDPELLAVPGEDDEVRAGAGPAGAVPRVAGWVAGEVAAAWRRG